MYVMVRLLTVLSLSKPRKACSNNMYGLLFSFHPWLTRLKTTHRSSLNPIKYYCHVALYITFA